MLISNATELESYPKPTILQGSNFEMDQEGMKTQLSQLNMLVQIMDRKLYDYLGKFEHDCLWLTIFPCPQFAYIITMALSSLEPNAIII